MTYTYNKISKQKFSPQNLANKLTALVAVMMLALSVGGMASAKELASGAPAPKPACSPVKSLSYKGDARVGELGFASISVDYSVTSCDKNVPVKVNVVMFQSSNGVEVYNNPDAPLSGRFDVNGVLVNTSYQVKVTVYDATTGAVQGTQTIFAAARTKPV